MKLVWLIAVLVLLVSCTKPIPLEDGPGGIKLNNTDDRPDIPRVNPQINDSEFIDAGEQPSRPPPIIQNNKTPSVDLDVPLGDPIGKHHPIITSAQFPLLRHSPVRVTGSLLIGYEEQLRFDFGANSTGRIMFGQDEDDAIASFLHFERGKPIFEYIVRLNQGTFHQVSGRDIQLLGHTYTIAEATNTTVVLYGKDVPYSLIFVENESLIANGSKQGSTLVRVRPNVISYTLYARGRSSNDVMLYPMESIAEEMSRGRLASLLYDVRYMGAPMQNSTVIGFDRTKFGYRMHVETLSGTQVIPLVEQDGGKLVLGKLSEPLRVKQCSFCINPESMFLLTSPDGKSFIMRYSALSNESKLLILRDLEGNRYDYKFVGNPGIDARADIIIDRYKFPVRIGKIINGTANISVEQGFRNGRVELVTDGGFIVRIGDPINMTLPIEIIIPASRTGKLEERTIINLSYNASLQDWMINAGNLTFIEDEDTLDAFGTTNYGMAVLLDKNKRYLPLNVGDEATLLIPKSRTYGIVRLEG